ncbi:MAG: hypothetical protein IH798_06840 [Gemmatimonadetes bacterium]|nr:hypothetical protein [Gemmatimonadota bacterium]
MIAIDVVSTGWMGAGAGRAGAGVALPRDVGPTAGASAAPDPIEPNGKNFVKATPSATARATPTKSLKPEMRFFGFGRPRRPGDRCAAEGRPYVAETRGGGVTARPDGRAGAGLDVNGRDGRGIGYFEDDANRFRLTPRHWSYLRVSEGCNQRCTFCTIPLKMLPTTRSSRSTRYSISFFDSSTAMRVSRLEQLTMNGVMELQLML